MTAIVYPSYVVDDNDQVFSHVQQVEITDAAAEIVKAAWCNAVTEMAPMSDVPEMFNRGANAAWCQGASIACRNKVPNWWFRDFADFGRLVGWFYWAARG